MSLPVKKLAVNNEEGIVKARMDAKEMAGKLGFNYMDQTRIATAVSELTRNALDYGGGGKVTIKPVEGDKVGLSIKIEDNGPGIKDLDKALKGGHSTSGGLGLGLSGAKKLMDEFEIQTSDAGTTIKIVKWR